MKKFNGRIPIGATDAADRVFDAYPNTNITKKAFKGLLNKYIKLRRPLLSRCVISTPFNSEGEKTYYWAEHCETFMFSNGKSKAFYLTYRPEENRCTIVRGPQLKPGWPEPEKPKDYKFTPRRRGLR